MPLAALAATLAMGDSTGLEAIFDRLEAGKRLSKQDLQTLVTAVRSQQVTLATGDRAVAVGGSADGAVIVTGDRNFIITGADAEAIRELMGTRSSTERVLLQAVKEEVSSRLKQSLHSQVLIQLRMEAQPGKVQRPWDLDVKIGDKPAEPIPDDWGVLQVFDEAYGKLLILGNPGVGKTTMLLELARELCERAQQQVEVPIPVLLNLSTRRNNQQSIQDWLVIELKSKYGIQRDLGKKWFKEQKLLMMLDGLDELESTQQELCVQAINQLMQDEYRPQYLVVCSRQEEYNIYKIRLRLNKAVLLHELTSEQIQKYLADLNQVEFWREMQQDSALLELSRNPFLLAVAVLSYENLALPMQPLMSTEKRLGLLLDAYVQRMLLRRTNDLNFFKQQAPTIEQTQHWLCQMAKRMQQESQTEFLIERLQPHHIEGHSGILTYIWFDLLLNVQVGRPFYGLTEKLRKKFGFSLKRMPGYQLMHSNLALAFLADFLEFIFFLIYYLRNQPTQRLRENLASLMLTEIATKEFIDEIEIFDTMKLSLNKLRTSIQIVAWTTSGAILGLFIQNHPSGSSGFTLSVVFGFLYGLCFSFRSGLCIYLSVSDIKERSFPNFSINRLIKNCLYLSLFQFVFWLSIGFVSGLLMTILSIKNGLVLGLIGGLSWAGFRCFNFVLNNGGKAVIQHYLLRFILRQEGTIPNNYIQFLDYCTECLLLQKVGGRYRFIHRLLQDHFAAMLLEK
ncbi:MAG: NACHT domain-containing protein [Stenomitos rutilans HA7619-LM2]|nr:NACHT domain-containing protein [Stenomitos rutilans HA7619-LM2]